MKLDIPEHKKNLVQCPNRDCEDKDCSGYLPHKKTNSCRLNCCTHSMVGKCEPAGVCEPDCPACLVIKTLKQAEPYLNHKEDCLEYRHNYISALMNSKDPNEKIERECNCGFEQLTGEQ